MIYYQFRVKFIPEINLEVMILKERQAYLNSVFSEVEGFNRRRTLVSTKCFNAQLTFNSSADEKDKQEVLRLEKDLDLIENLAPSIYDKLRNKQSKYVVEYEAELMGTNDMVEYSEQLFFLTDCYIDTNEDGWDFEDSKTQDLLYEVGDFILLHRSAKFTIKNIKRI